MKLKEEFVTYDMNGETVMVCASGAFSGIAKSNETAAFILECLKEDTTIEAIAERMLEKYPDAPADRVVGDVAKIIDVLRGINAIDE